jgi:hypothetical protein
MLYRLCKCMPPACIDADGLTSGSTRMRLCASAVRGAARHFSQSVEIDNAWWMVNIRAVDLT